MKGTKGFVITGDIENFTSLNSQQREQLIVDAKVFLETLVKQSSYAQMFRGDSFQLYFKSAKQCLTAVLKMKCWFLTYQQLGLQIRNAIGVGAVDYLNENVLRSDGAAFHLSGRNFDTLPHGNFLNIYTDKLALNNQLHIITTLLNIILDKWTIQQAEVIIKAIDGINQTEIANLLKISQGAVNSRLKLSKWNEVKEAITYLQSIL